MKKIKDYQHLYKDIELVDGKLPLRHLSSMTEEEEKVLMGNGLLQNTVKLNPNKTMDEYWHSSILTMAKNVEYLLSKHFDLFGLIEAGLAIDKTKL